MEDGLGVRRIARIGRIVQVLILVLVEDGLGVEGYRVIYSVAKKS